MVGCYLIHFLLNRNKKSYGLFFSEVGNFIFLSCILAFLTPVLNSLTVSYTSDTVTMHVAFFSFCHLWTYDY